MQGFEYFDMIQKQILFEKFYLPRVRENPPPAIIIPASHEEPEVKIPLPIKQINEEYHIKKLNKNIKKKNNIFLGCKNNFSNIHFKLSNKNIINNYTKKELFSHDNKLLKKKGNCIINKIGKYNNIILKKSKNNKFNKSWELIPINYELNIAYLEKKIHRIQSTNCLRRKLKDFSK